MERVKLSELNFTSRREAINFLKSLWAEEETKCPVCGNTLELLHKRAKRDTCDWQCKGCDKTYKTLHLLDEINEQMPD